MARARGGTRRRAFHVTEPSFNDPALAPVFRGWNVWAVYQVKDLDFTLLGMGVSRDRQLQVWVEDHVRLDAPGTDVADPLDLKGSQVQILAGDSPAGLKSFRRKEQVPGDVMLLDGEADRRVVRFYNRGDASALPWPHDDNYLLDEVYQPDEKQSITSGPAPREIASGTSSDLGKAAGDLLPDAGTLIKYALGAAFVVGTGIVLARAVSGEFGKATARLGKVRAMGQRVSLGSKLSKVGT